MKRSAVGGSDAVIGVVGEDASSIADRLDGDGGGATVVEPTASGEADVVVAVGERALLSLVRAHVSVPVLPVSVGTNVEDVPRHAVERAVADLREGEWTVVDRPVLTATVADEAYPALMDVMAVTEEPAKISEYTIETGRGDERRTVDRVRADGVVVSTPAGTPGYASSAGGPVLEPDLAAVAVVPVGPFRVEQSHYVLALPTTVTVARDEVPVSLLADDAAVGTVPAHEPITLSWGDPVSFVRTSVSRRSFGGPK